MAENQDIIDALAQAYTAEIETIANYIAASTNLDGVRAREIAESLEQDITEELGHAQKLAAQIHVLRGTVPGSLSLKFSQKSLQPPANSLDVISVIKGVIEAEDGAIETYTGIAELCDGRDFATQDLAIEILRDEQDHKREFVGYLMEFEQGVPKAKAD